MKERIVNIFLFINKDDFIEKLGALAHEMDGDDETKLSFLQKSVQEDLPKAKTFSLPETVIVVDMKTGKDHPRYLSYATYLDLSASGRAGDVFSEIVKHYKLPESFLCVITPVRDGKVAIDQVERLP